MKVKLVRRHGRNQAGRTYDYDEPTGQWLVDNGFGVPAKSESRSESRSEPESESGSEPPVTTRSRRRSSSSD